MKLPKIKYAFDEINELRAAFKEVQGSLSSMGFKLPGLDKMIAESMTAFGAYETANEQLKASLEATRGSADTTINDLIAQAEKLQQTTLFSPTQTQEAQALMLSFTNVKGKILGEAIPAIQDLATKMSGSGAVDLKGATALVGKALNDPIKGIKALQSAGVNFNGTQEETIKNLVKTGKTAEAQKLMLDQLGKEFGGSANAARLAKGGYGDYEVQLEKLQQVVGKVISVIGTSFSPVFKAAAWAAGLMLVPLKSMADWMGKNTDIVEGLAVGLGIGATAFLLVNGVAALNAWYMGLSSTAIILNTLVTEGLSAAWLALSMAMNANPIGFIIAGIVILYGAIYIAYQRSETFRAVLSGIGAVATALIPVFQGLGNVMLGMFTMDPALITKGFIQSADAVRKIAESGGIGGVFKKGYNISLAESKKKADEEKEKEKAALKPKVPAIPGGFSQMATKGAGNAGSPKGFAAKERVGGSTTVKRISVVIQKLVGIEVLNTTNIKEGFSETSSLIKEALLKSIRDADVAVSGE